MTASAKQPNPIARVLLAAAAAWHPQAHPPTPDWCAAELRLPAETSADPGPFDLATRPYWREPLALFDDPEVRSISIMADAQAGKTVLATAALLSRAEIDPAPSIFCGPDQDAMREMRDKVYGMAESSPRVAHRVPPERLWNDRWIDLDSMVCYLAFSGSSQRMRGRTCKYVFCTEVDVWQDSPRLGQSAKIIKARVKAFAEHKLFYESTPTDENSTIAALYKAGDQRRFLVPCPRCGHHQELRFFPHKSGEHAGRGGVAGLQDERSNWRSADEVRESAYYVCERGCRIESGDKADMVAAGRWCPRGCRIDKRGKLSGRAERSPRNASFQISGSLCGEQNSFGDVAGAYVEARESNSLRVFWNNWLGLPYSTSSAMPHWKTLGRRLAGSHRRGTAPPECFFLTGAADVQADRVYWSVKGWGDRLSNWTIDWGVLQRDKDVETGDALISTDLAQLDAAVLDVLWPIAGDGSQKNPFGRASLAVRLLAVDAGHRITDVHQFLRAHPGDRVRAVRGDLKVDPADLFKMHVVEKNARTGKPYEGGLELWGIFVNAFKADLLDRFQIEPGRPGAIQFPSDVFDAGEDYLRQLVNESPVQETLPSGKQIQRWVVRDKALGEHYWDLEVYNRALAEMITGGQWDSSQWPRPKKPQPKDHAATAFHGQEARADGPEDFAAR
jgi:phage terminase large subunit GpA-like protein